MSSETTVDIFDKDKKEQRKMIKKSVKEDNANLLDVRGDDLEKFNNLYGEVVDGTFKFDFPQDCSDDELSFAKHLAKVCDMSGKSFPHTTVYHIFHSFFYQYSLEEVQKYLIILHNHKVIELSSESEVLVKGKENNNKTFMLNDEISFQFKKGMVLETTKNSILESKYKGEYLTQEEQQSLISLRSTRFVSFLTVFLNILIFVLWQIFLIVEYPSFLT